MTEVSSTNTPEGKTGLVSRIIGLFRKADARQKIAPNCEPPDYHDVIGGWWGNKIEIMSFEPDNYRIVGWKPFEQRPKEGSVILVEGQKSWMWFVITNIEWCGNPMDMFFADMEPIHQEAKPFEFPAHAGTV